MKIENADIESYQKRLNWLRNRPIHTRAELQSTGGSCSCSPLHAHVPERRLCIKMCSVCMRACLHVVYVCMHVCAHDYSLCIVWGAHRERCCQIPLAHCRCGSDAQPQRCIVSQSHSILPMHTRSSTSMHHTCIQIYIHRCMRTYIHTYLPTYIRTYIDIHTLIHIQHTHT